MRSFTDTERRVVPRWREFYPTVKLGELRAVHRASRVLDPQGILPVKVQEWRAQQDLVSASELISTAMVVDKIDAADAAIDYVLVHPDAPDFMKQSVGHLIRGQVDTQLTNPVWEDALKISHLKSVVRDWHRNPIAWTELALLYSKLGQRMQAQRCVSVALELAPSNRYVLRCAARFFVHAGTPDRAAGVLRASGVVKSDPWLMATEIAASQIASAPSHLVKMGKKIVESSGDPWHTTELAAAIGTVELENGAVRRATKAFRHSAIRPNDNVKAQLLWASTAHNRVDLSGQIEVLDAQDHEARALECKKDKQWSDAVVKCEAWGKDESYSNRPFSLGSYLAIEALGDGKIAEGFAKNGLQSNPQDAMLYNNLAVAQAMQGNLKGSTESLRNAIRFTDGSDGQAIVIKATEGMIAYREGNVDAGRVCYLDAMQKAHATRKADYKAAAALYMVNEELAAKTLASKRLAASVLDAMRVLPTSESEAFVDRIREQARGHRGSAAAIDEANLKNKVIGDVVNLVERE